MPFLTFARLAASRMRFCTICRVNGAGQAGLAGLDAQEISIEVPAADADLARAFIQEHLAGRDLEE